MENKRTKSDVLIYLIATLSFIGCALSFFFIDGKIGIHWNSQWQIDNYVDKKYIFLIGAAPILILLFHDFILMKDSGNSSLMKHPVVGNKLRWPLVLMMIVSSWVSVSTGLSIDINYKMIAPIGFGICFIILGNYLPTVRRNYLVGIRTHLTMTDNNCWRKSNRFLGYIIAIEGLLMIIAGVVQNKILNRFVVWFLIVGVIITMYYSYFITRREKYLK